MAPAPGVNTSSHSIDNFIECNRLQIGFAFPAQWA
jgi:hypothetical protein